MSELQIGRRKVGTNQPTYFIADISANHDGELDRAKELIHLAAKAGADAAKFQNFRAEKIVSKHGFETLSGQLSHQAKWKSSVFEVYQKASLPWSWSEDLRQECARAGIDYFSTPYDLESVDMLDPHVCAYKIGSGDITWLEILKRIAYKGKPVILATGASNIFEVRSAVGTILQINPDLCLMQCNTNYTGDSENLKYINLNVLNTYARIFPGVVLGLSDHTPGHVTVLGAVSLGAKVIEKHFTDDNLREGPDHPFSMNPATWREMVDRTRELEYALGSSEKHVAENEQETVVIQRRCLRAVKEIRKGMILERDMIEALRPAPSDSICPNALDHVIGKAVTKDVEAGEYLTFEILESAEVLV